MLGGHFQCFVVFITLPFHLCALSDTITTTPVTHKTPYGITHIFLGGGGAGGGVVRETEQSNMSNFKTSKLVLQVQPHETLLLSLHGTLAHSTLLALGLTPFNKSIH